MMRSDIEEHKYVHENILEENKKIIENLQEEMKEQNIQDYIMSNIEKKIISKI